MAVNGMGGKRYGPRKSYSCRFDQYQQSAFVEFKPISITESILKSFAYGVHPLLTRIKIRVFIDMQDLEKYKFWKFSIEAGICCKKMSRCCHSKGNYSTLHDITELQLMRSKRHVFHDNYFISRPNPMVWPSLESSQRDDSNEWSCHRVWLRKRIPPYFKVNWSPR